MPRDQKYEREIAEILERMDRDEPRGAKLKRETRQTLRESQSSLSDRWANVRGVGGGVGTAAGWTWIAVTVGLGLLGLFLRGLYPPLGWICALLMFLAFFSPLLRQLGGPSADESAQTWRGRDMRGAPGGNVRSLGWGANLRYRWRRFFGGGR